MKLYRSYLLFELNLITISLSSNKKMIARKAKLNLITISFKSEVFFISNIYRNESIQLDDK